MLDFDKYFDKTLEYHGQKFKIVACQDADAAQHLKETLHGFVCAATETYPELNQGKIVGHFMDTISNLITIRIDTTDLKKDFFLERISNHMSVGQGKPKELCEQALRAFACGDNETVEKLGLTEVINHYIKNDGLCNYTGNQPSIIMLNYADMQKSNDQYEKLSADRALCHEFMHAMSAWATPQNNLAKVIKNPTINNLYEGLNEYYTQQVFEKMHSQSNRSVSYPKAYRIVKSFLDTLSQEDQKALFEDYVTGNGAKYLEKLDCFKSPKGYGIMEFISRNGLSKIDGKSAKEDTYKILLFASTKFGKTKEFDYAKPATNKQTDTELGI